MRNLTGNWNFKEVWIDLTAGLDFLELGHKYCREEKVLILLVGLI